jgi:hypothetical protein
MNNLQPGVMELVLRAHFATIQLEAEHRRLATMASEPRRPRTERPGRRPMGLLRSLRSLGARAVPALGR